MKKWQQVCLLAMVSMLGCSMNSVGTEADARRYFDTEFKKWMAGESNAVTTMSSRIQRLKAPISYDIRSVVRDEPIPLAFENTANLPEDWTTSPAYKLNVAIEWTSQAGTPLTNITAYTLTWNASAKRWHVIENF